MNRNAPILWAKLNAILPMPQTWGVNDYSIASWQDEWLKIHYSMYGGYSLDHLVAHVYVKPVCPDFAVYRHCPVLTMGGRAGESYGLLVLRVRDARQWLKHFNRVASEAVQQHVDYQQLELF